MKKQRKAFPKSLIFFLFFWSLEIICSNNKSGISPKNIRNEKPLTGHERVNKHPERRARIVVFFEKNI